MTRIFLVPALLLPLAACGDFCIAFCTDQTGLQRDYVDRRDECRELAELKASTMPPPENAPPDKNGKTRLVSLFSECMNGKGWAIPAPADDKNKNATPLAVGLQAGPSKAGEPPPPPPGPAPQKMLDARNQRAAECAFARQAADSSMISRKRAEACDMECKEAERLAPEAPKPAACR